MKKLAIIVAASLFASALFSLPLPPAQTVSIAAPSGQSAAAADEKVTFNAVSKKYHCPTCRYAKACTRNCITTTLADAKERGGVACKVCGGTCAAKSADNQRQQHVRCCDGTLSPSCTYVHSGCCSHHGGVCQ